MATFPITERMEYPVSLKRKPLVSETQSSREIELEILDDRSFMELLRLETKRSERSQSPILLMRLSVEGLLAESASHKAVRQIKNVMGSSARETDVLGWHEGGKTLGVIFTGLGSDNSRNASAIVDRITRALRKALNRNDFDQVMISCRLSADYEVSSKAALAFHPAVQQSIGAAAGRL